VARRWEKDTDPKSHPPVTALREALRQLEAGEIEAEHIMVVHAHHDSDGVSHVGFLQAGKFCELAQVGMMQRAARLIAQFDNER
jgi:hypothetical protein